jgi:hypothetical protein
VIVFRLRPDVEVVDADAFECVEDIVNVLDACVVVDRNNNLTLVRHLIALSDVSKITDCSVTLITPLRGLMQLSPLLVLRPLFTFLAR